MVGVEDREHLEFYIKEFDFFSLWKFTIFTIFNSAFQVH